VTTTLFATKNAEKKPTTNLQINEKSASYSIACMNCLVPGLAILTRFEMG
jgi:hypothetical protein